MLLGIDSEVSSFMNLVWMLDVPDFWMLSARLGFGDSEYCYPCLYHTVLVYT